MPIHYTITDFHTATGCVQVNFHNGDIPEGVVFSINLPMVDGRYPNGEALDALIHSYSPKEMFARAAMLRDVPPPEVVIAASGLLRAQPYACQGNVSIYNGKDETFVAQPLVRMGSLDIPLEVV